jgi:hypothetical protein
MDRAVTCAAAVVTAVGERMTIGRESAASEHAAIARRNDRDEAAALIGRTYA